MKDRKLISKRKKEDNIGRENEAFQHRKNTHIALFATQRCEAAQEPRGCGEGLLSAFLFDSVRIRYILYTRYHSCLRILSRWISTNMVVNIRTHNMKQGVCSWVLPAYRTCMLFLKKKKCTLLEGARRLRTLTGQKRGYDCCSSAAFYR